VFLVDRYRRLGDNFLKCVLYFFQLCLLRTATTHTLTSWRAIASKDITMVITLWLLDKHLQQVSWFPREFEFGWMCRCWLTNSEMNRTKSVICGWYPVLFSNCSFPINLIGPLDLCCHVPLFSWKCMECEWKWTLTCIISPLTPIL